MANIALFTALVFLLLNFFGVYGKIIFLQLQQCCHAGTNWIHEKHECTNYENEIGNIPTTWLGLCFSAFEICCSKEYNNQHCLSGIEAAKKGLDCNGNNKQNSTFYKNCCKSCQIGLAVAASGNNCSNQLFTKLSDDESYKACCNDINSETFILSDNDDICGKLKNLCSHICENTVDSYVCKCPPGYKLDDNRVTCTIIENDDDSSEKESNESCSMGYKKNEKTGKCEDIDECFIGTSDCDYEQYCYNTEGSYACHNIKTTSCPTGFQFKADIDSCEDIDECLEDMHDCFESEQICINTKGGFICENKTHTKCMPGFIFNIETKKCEDIDECTENPCEDEYKCVNYPGSYECHKTFSSSLREKQINSHPPFYSNHALIQCGPGYRLKHSKCIDIDECLTDKNACDSNQLCINEQGGYRCDCKIGFRMDSTLNACIDVNECQLNNHNCLSSQRCDNTIGSYTCIRLQSCGTGYTLNAETGNCDDDDECDLGTHDCPIGYECRNTMGSFRCDKIRYITTRKLFTYTTTTSSTITTTTTKPIINQSKNNWTYSSSQTLSHLNLNVPLTQKHWLYNVSCTPGFQRSNQGACIDVDECRQPNTCGSHQRCINTNGSFRCQNLLVCSGGFKSASDGSTCIDIDECSTGEHNCGPDQICSNKMGGFICSCPPGHILNKYRRCDDINECELERGQVCPVNSECINTMGSYRCECKTGFRKHYESDKICIDIDECEEIKGLCEHKCINFWGSYRCSCNTGYELSINNRTCNDVDECEVHKAYNLCMSQCYNVPGSYQCTCPSGYELGLDKSTCRDIDECSISSVCSGRNEICTNIRGSYRCTTITCPYGYKIDSDQKNRCRIISNFCEGEECFHKPSSYTYNFITLVSKMIVAPQGRTLFTLRGPSWYDHIDFELKLAKVQASRGVDGATEQHFSTTQSQNQVQLSLMRSLEGPQDVELELSMTVFSNGQPRGKSVAKIIIIVSQYTF